MLTNCAICGTPFESRDRKNTCSPECRRFLLNKTSREWQQKHRVLKQRKCKVCGKVIANSSRKNIPYTCSPECKKIYLAFTQDKFFFQRRKLKKFLERYCERGLYLTRYAFFCDCVQKIAPNINREFINSTLRKNGFSLTICKKRGNRTIIGLRFNERGFKRFGVENLCNLSEKELDLTSASACKLLSCAPGQGLIKELCDKLSSEEQALIDLDKTIEIYKEIEKELLKWNAPRAWKVKISLALYLANPKITQDKASQLTGNLSVSTRNLYKLLTLSNPLFIKMLRDKKENLKNVLILETRKEVS